MHEREVTLVEIIRNPGPCVYEAYELSIEGHYYLYRYDPAEGVFQRATVPAGAAAVHFRPLPLSEKVPIGGWYIVEKKKPAESRPKLVVARPAPGSA